MAETTYHRPLIGIGLKLASVAAFLAMMALLKATNDLPPGEMVFFRSLFALLPLFAFLGVRGEIRSAFVTTNLGGQLWRGAIGVASMSLSFFALTRLPLPEATILSYAIPIVTIILSALVLREQVRAFRWAAVCLGLVGVGIVIWPRLTLISGDHPLGAAETIGVAAALLAATLAGGVNLMIRTLVQTEKSSTIVLYYTLLSALLSLLTLPFGWHMPSPAQWGLLLAAGIAGGIAQALLTECYRYAQLSTIAPFEYASIVLSIVIGYVAFADVPTPQMLMGGALIVAAGIFIILREHQLRPDATAVQNLSPR